MIRLQEINRGNLWDIIDLKVSREQESLIASNAVSIAQSKIQPECIPLGVYRDGTPVGFAMYCIDSEDNEWWIYRLMIDARYQGKGYGKEAFKLILNNIREDKTRNRVFLSVDRRGIKSTNLCESMGFKYTGDALGRESIMVLDGV